MIKLTRSECPEELTDEKRLELTKIYKETKKSVWKKPYIESALLSSSNNKCAFCECELNIESKYMEVEHFHDKSTYPDDVVNWNNLLPSCKRCNGKKSNFNTKVNAFINPYDMNPKEHLIMDQYRLYPLSLAGKNTIEQLLLNDRNKLQSQRYEIASNLVLMIEDLFEKVRDYKDGIKRTNRTKINIINRIEGLMEEALPSSSYCATVATVMSNDVHFLTIIDILKEEQLWSAEMDNTFSEIIKCSLDTDVSKYRDFLQSI
ncbi:Septu protein PtuB [Priestia megaterium]